MTIAQLNQVACALGRDIAKALPGPLLDMGADGAVPIDQDRVVLFTKATAIAATVAAPGASGVGRRLTLIAGTDAAHVATFTGATLHDGTTGGHTTWTSAAFIGSSLTVVGISATQWAVESFNLGAIA